MSRISEQLRSGSPPPDSPLPAELSLLTEEQIRRIAVVGWMRAPREACGVIDGRGRVYELNNRAPDDQPDSFELHGDDLLPHWPCIIWHTHPAGQIGPSRGDLRNREPGLSYLVVSLTEDGPVAARY